MQQSPKKMLSRCDDKPVLSKTDSTNNATEKRKTYNQPRGVVGSFARKQRQGTEDESKRRRGK